MSYKTNNRRKQCCDKYIDLVKKRYARQGFIKEIILTY